MSYRWSAVLMLAWIAWMHTEWWSKGLEEWSPLGGTESMEECKSDALEITSNSIREFRRTQKENTYTQIGSRIEATYRSGDRSSITFVCLPDTVDPRKPKEK